MSNSPCSTSGKLYKSDSTNLAGMPSTVSEPNQVANVVVTIIARGSLRPAIAKSAEFLTKNSKGSLEYLALTDKEKAFFSSPKKVDQVNSTLNKSELQKVNSVDTKNPHLFDDLNTRIQ